MVGPSFSTSLESLFGFFFSGFVLFWCVFAFWLLLAQNVYVVFLGLVWYQIIFGLFFLGLSLFPSFPFELFCSRGYFFLAIRVLNQGELY